MKNDKTKSSNINHTSEGKVPDQITHAKRINCTNITMSYNLTVNNLQKDKNEKNRIKSKSLDHWNKKYDDLDKNS